MTDDTPGTDSVVEPAAAPTSLPAPPQKRPNTAGWVIIAVVLVAIVGGIGWAINRPSDAPSVHVPSGVGTSAVAASDKTYSVTYKVTAAGGGNIDSVTYVTPSGTSQASDLLTTWSQSAMMSGTDKPYVSVQNGNDMGSVTCEIWVDGVQSSTNTATGGYAIATCHL